MWACVTDPGPNGVCTQWVQVTILPSLSMSDGLTLGIGFIAVLAIVWGFRQLARVLL